jgi:hypothetical protein
MLTMIVLASSMKLEYPMNDSLPNVEHTRDRLLARIFHFRQHSVNREIATDEDFELLYAYGKQDQVRLLNVIANSLQLW